MRIYIEDCLARSLLPIQLRPSVTIKRLQEAVEDIFDLPGNFTIYLFLFDEWKYLDPSGSIESYALKEDSVLCATMNRKETQQFRKKLRDGTFDIVRRIKDTSDEKDGVILIKYQAK